jgi:hypothetical protein
MHRGDVRLRFSYCSVRLYFCSQYGDNAIRVLWAGGVKNMKFIESNRHGSLCCLSLHGNVRPQSAGATVEAIG